MTTMQKLADRVLSGLVPSVEASACKDYVTCQNGIKKRCYISCGRPTFCVRIGRCGGGGCRGC